MERCRSVIDPGHSVPNRPISIRFCHHSGRQRGRYRCRHRRRENRHRRYLSGCRRPRHPISYLHLPTPRYCHFHRRRQQSFASRRWRAGTKSDSPDPPHSFRRKLVPRLSNIARPHLPSGGSLLPGLQISSELRSDSKCSRSCSDHPYSYDLEEPTPFDSNLK
jgi:hypothetical protein